MYATSITASQVVITPQLRDAKISDLFGSIYNPSTIVLLPRNDDHDIVFAGSMENGIDFLHQQAVLHDSKVSS